VDMLNLSDKVKILDFLKGSMSLVEFGLALWKKESGICSIQDKELEIRSSFW
jgi:hypothetical protein